MALKISCILLAAFVVSTTCLPYRFGGSAGASSHTAVGGSIGGEVGKESNGTVAKVRGKVFTDWSGAAGAGGYAGQGEPKYEPTSNITGIGIGGMVGAHVGTSAGGEVGGVYKDGKLDAGASSIGKLDKSGNASGNGFVGTVEQGEAEHIGGYGVRAANRPTYGSYDSQYNAYGVSYDAPYVSPNAVRTDMKG